MTRIPNLALLSPDLGEQLSALQSLKNEIVGHSNKKEKWIEAGVLEPVVKVLSNSRSAGKTSRTDSRSRASSSTALTSEEAVRLQALQILASFSDGGYPFLAPIHAAGALSVIQSNISPNENPPQVVVAALRATINIAETSAQALPTSATDLSSLADIVFVPSLLEAFRCILTTPVRNHIVQTQRNLVARLISLLCREERHQVDLATVGILDALATNLASAIVSRGFVIPGAEAVAQNEGTSDLIPDSAAQGTDVTAIFEALSTIIGDSPWRTSALIYAPAMLTIFPNTGPPRRSKDMKSCANAFEVAGLSSVTSKDLGVMDSLLPVVPEYQASKASSVITFSQTSPFRPSLARDLSGDWSSPHSTLMGNSSAIEAAVSNAEGEIEEPESPLIPWLIYTIRSTDGMERIMAASVLTSLFKTGFTNKSRQAQIGRLIVPILLQLLEDIGSISSHAEALFIGMETTKDQAMIERCLMILARLVTDNDFLQKCAFDCSGIKIVSNLLKGAYEPLPEKQARSWNPTPQHEIHRKREIGLPTSQLGPRSLPPLQSHRIRVREAALKAIAALAGQDEYRKAFVEQDLAPFIVESLQAKPSKPSKDRPRSPRIYLGPDDGAGPDPAYGANPNSVIIAACHALRILSRSPSILRTTLEDYSVANPAFRLLSHADIEVQIAASGLMCNLVTDVAPMKERLNLVGVMRVLCNLTRSQNPVLRLNALWALKHWVDGIDIKEKKDCVDELTPGWLVQLICDDTEDEAYHQRLTKNEKQVTNELDEDVEMGQAGEDSRASVSSLQNASVQSNGQARTSRLRQTRRKIDSLREAELNEVRKVREDDLAIQEQGLDFVRNLIGPVKSASDSASDQADMIDCLFNVLDQHRFFEIMHSKLQFKVLHPFSRRYSTSRQNSRVVYPQARIITTVLYILVHLAASVPRHRQILMAQTKLMTEAGKLFNHKDKNVRVALCHLLTNLTWRDDPEDEANSRQRAGELKKLGLLSKLENLESDDDELDVRERAKAAIWQINKPTGF